MSRVIGLKDLYTALVTKNTKDEYVASTPSELARMINAKVDEKWNSANVYSNDSLEGIVRNYDHTEIELEINRLILEKMSELYGQEWVNGFLTGSNEDKAPDLAIGWRNKLGDGTYQFCWYYCVTVADGFKADYATMADKIKSGSNKIKLVGRCREKIDTGKDGKKKNLYVVRVGEDELLEENIDAKTAIEDWFGKVQEPSYK